MLARLYYTLEALGVAEQHMQAVFDHLHKDRKRMAAEEDVIALLTGLGIDKDKAEATWNSPALNEPLQAAHGQLGQHRITGVPVFLVAGQYTTSVNMAGSRQALFEVIEFLLAK